MKRYWNEDIFRFANILNLNSINVDNILNVVKTVKSETSLNLTCANYDTRLSNDEIFSHVRAVEQMLKIESSEHINETLTDEALQTAAEIFIYLSSWFASVDKVIFKNTIPPQNICFDV